MGSVKRCKICKITAEVSSDGRCRSCRDILAATRAGTSYGLYMAQKDAVVTVELIPGEEIEPVLPTAARWKACISCGAMFYAKNIRRVYCSRNCSKRMHRREKLGMETLSTVSRDRVCAICGVEFRAHNNDPRIKYCSNECRYAAEQEAQKRRRAAERRCENGYG